MDMKRHLVTAKHELPQFAIEPAQEYKTHKAVTRDGSALYFAEGTGGCSRDYPTRHGAIRALLSARSCYDIQITDIEVQP